MVKRATERDKSSQVIQVKRNVRDLSTELRNDASSLSLIEQIEKKTSTSLDSD